MATPPTSHIAFISGPLDTGADGLYFQRYYVPKINSAIKRGDHFIIGPLPHGVDADALEYLLAYPVSPDRITIFVTPSEHTVWGSQFHAKGVGVSIVDGPTGAERDTTMTAASTYDILRWRKQHEASAFYGRMFREGYVTNTERNWRRRQGLTETEPVNEDEVDIFKGESTDEPRIS
jgi:hypothetical protein